MEKNNFDNFDQSKPPYKVKWFGLTMGMFWAFFIALALSNVLSPYLSQILSGLLSGIAPLLIGIIGAFIFHRLVNFTENVVLKNTFKNNPHKFAIKRTISILIVLLIVVAFFLLIFSILVPKIVLVIQELSTGAGDGWDQMVNNVVNEVTSLIKRWFGADVDQASVREVFDSLFDNLKETVFYIDGLMEFSMSLVTGAINFLMGMILTVLFIKDKEKIARFSRRFVYANFKKERADEMCVMTTNSGKILFDYVICKLIEFSLLFTALGFTYMVLGLRFTWELALIIGLFNFIPYFGIYIGALPSILFTLIFNSMDAALYMALATFIVSTLVLNILIPVITGNKLKVSALIVTASIVLGGAMFGFLGMLLAPPIAAIISVIIMGNIELKENHIKYMMQLELAREKNKEEQMGSMTLPTSDAMASTKSKPKNLALENQTIKNMSVSNDQPKNQSKSITKPTVPKSTSAQTKKSSTKPVSKENKNSQK